MRIDDPEVVPYGAPDIDLARPEVAPVLRPGGRLVAAASGERHPGELRALLGRDEVAAERHFLWRVGEDPPARHVARVRRRDVIVAFPVDAEAARGYLGSSIAHAQLADPVSGPDEPCAATRRSTVFVAETGS